MIRTTEQFAKIVIDMVSPLRMIKCILKGITADDADQTGCRIIMIARAFGTIERHLKLRGWFSGSVRSIEANLQDGSGGLAIARPQNSLADPHCHQMHREYH